MSSRYKVVCLSHSPALVEDDVECDNYSVGARHLGDLRESHPECDLVIGRYSYPLLEVRCFCAAHREPLDWKAETLALIALAQSVPSLSRIAHKSGAPCWPAHRLAKLKNELAWLDEPRVSS